MEKHYSSTLNAVLTQLVPDGSLVLDLGSLSSGTTEAFLQKKCRCHVEDLAEYLEKLKVSPQDPIVALDNHILSTKSNVRFNVILCWDLLNYLSIEIINHLFQKLTPYIAQDCVLHFIRYTGAKITQSPKRFRLQKDFTFDVFEEPNAERIYNQPHSTVKLLKHFDQFSLRDTVMNQQGMQKGMVEYLLQYKMDSTKKSVQDFRQSGLVQYFVEKERQRTIEMPALNKVLKELSETSSLAMMDLGKNIRKNLQSINQKFRHVYTEDVFASINWQKKINGDVGVNLSPNLLKMEGCEPLDLVLVWDIFNYCSGEQIEGLIQLLAKNLKDNTLVHLLLYRQKNIPGVPYVFELDDEMSVKVSGNFQVKDSLPAMHASVVSVIKRLPNFRIVENNNIKNEDASLCQELLLRYRA